MTARKRSNFLTARNFLCRPVAVPRRVRGRFSREMEMTKRTGILGALAMSAAFAFTGGAVAQEAELWHFFSSGSEAEGLDGLVEVANGINADNPITPRVFPDNI